MPDPATLLPVAHAGHWIVWVLYALPVVAVAAAIWISARRATAAEAEAPETGEREAEAGRSR